VKRVVAAEVRKSGLGDADTTAKHDEIHRDGKRLVAADTVEETHGNISDIGLLSVDGIRTDLEVTWVGTALAVDKTSVGRADIKVLLCAGLASALGSLDDELLHGLAELLEARDILSDLVDLLDSHGLEVGDEVARLDEIGLALSIKTTVDTIIRTLEETELAVGGDGLGDRSSILADLKALLAHVARRLSWVGLIGREPLAGNGDRGADIILHLHLGARDVVDTSLEGTPHVAVRRHTNTKEAGADLTVVELDLVAVAAVDEIHREVCTPVQTPLFGPETLHVVHNREDVRGEVLEPLVVLVSVDVAGSEQLDDTADGTLARKKRTVINTLGVLVALGVVVGEDLIDEGKVLLGIVHEERSVHESTIDVLGELTLATTRHGAGLVEHSATTISTDETPCRSSRVVDSLETITVRKDVSLARNKTDGLLAASKGDGVLIEAEGRILRNVDDVGEALIDGITLRLHLDVFLAEKLDGIGKGVAGEMRPLFSLIFSVGAGTEGIAREGKGTTTVLLLSVTVQVGSKAEVRLDLLLAVTKVVISDDGKDDTLLGTKAHLEGLAVVIALILGLPAHALSTLLLGGLVPLGETKRLLGDLVEVRSHDDETSVAGPVKRIKGGIVLRKEWITSIAKDGLEEVEAADKTAGSKAEDLHGLNRADSGNLRNHDRAEKKTAHGVDRSKRRGRSGVGKKRILLRRIKSLVQHASKDSLGNSELIRADDELVLAISNVEGASSGTLIKARIVKNTTVLDLVGGHILINMTVGAKREAELTRNSVLAENKGLERNLWNRHTSIRKNAGDELVDTANNRSRNIGLKKTGLLTIVTNKICRAR